MARAFDTGNDIGVYNVVECSPPPPSMYIYAELVCLVLNRIALFIGIPPDANAMCAFVRIIRNVVEKIVL